MLKSLFFRQKADNDKLLPPPPPFPSMELEQEAPSEDEFGNLFNELGLELEEIKPKAKPQKKLSKKERKKLAKIKAKESRLKKKEAKRKSAQELYDSGKDFDFGPGFQDLEELGIADLKAGEETKPKEIEEAEAEITSAIEGIRKQERKSFFGGLFKKKPAQGQIEMPEIAAGNLDSVKKKIGNVRSALMKFDLESAKNCYIEIMHIYNKLNPEEQAQVYNEIRGLYYERKSAEELKV